MELSEYIASCKEDIVGYWNDYKRVSPVVTKRNIILKKYWKMGERYGAIFTSKKPSPYYYITYYAQKEDVVKIYVFKELDNKESRLVDIGEIHFDNIR